MAREQLTESWMPRVLAVPSIRIAAVGRHWSIARWIRGCPRGVGPAALEIRRLGRRLPCCDLSLIERVEERSRFVSTDGVAQN